MKKPHQLLFEEGILDQNQFEYLDKIERKTIFSVYYELRTLLYLGVLLLTTGIGFIIYLHLSQAAHIVLITVLLGLESACVYYIQKHALPYSRGIQKEPTPYFSYVVLFSALLLISIFTYILIQFDLVEKFIDISTLITALIFFYGAFRYDHRGILSLAIVAFSAYWGIKVSPVDWAMGYETNWNSVYFTQMGLGILYTAAGVVAEIKDYKKHFAFTFKNFGLLLLFIGLISVSTHNDIHVGWALITSVIGIIVAVYSWKLGEYLFFVYGSVFAYLGITLSLISILDTDFILLGIFYLMASLGGFVWMIERIITAKRKKS